MANGSFLFSTSLHAAPSFAIRINWILLQHYFKEIDPLLRNKLNYCLEIFREPYYSNFPITQTRQLVGDVSLIYHSSFTIYATYHVSPDSQSYTPRRVNPKTSPREICNSTEGHAHFPGSHGISICKGIAGSTIEQAVINDSYEY